MANGTSGRRTPGAKPADGTERETRVAAAVRELLAIGAAFSVAEVAEKAGVSRATIYRDRRLRDVIGAKGDVPRPVDPTVHARLSSRHQDIKSKNRELRQQLQDLEQSWEEMRERAHTAESRLKQVEVQFQSAERRAAALAAQVARGTAGPGAPLAQIAAQAGPEALRRARRQLALALHPDQYGHDPIAAALANEMLKTLNTLTD